MYVSQAAEGIALELEILRAAITRWSGVFLRLLRNIQIKVALLFSCFKFYFR
jgi:hypothetical protein